VDSSLVASFEQAANAKEHPRSKIEIFLIGGRYLKIESPEQAARDSPCSLALATAI
jgi:hypothetical protein